jgi:protein phosphatase
MSPDPVVDALPSAAMVLLVGAAGSGKSTWAAARFKPSEILSSDAYREQVAGDAADQSATADAFKVLHLVAAARMRRGLRTVVDATNLTEGARRSLLRLAGKADRPVVAVVFDLSLERCLVQNAMRQDRQVPPEVVCRHHRALQTTLRRLPGEGYVNVSVLRDEDISPV